MGKRERLKTSKKMKVKAGPKTIVARDRQQGKSRLHIRLKEPSRLEQLPPELRHLIYANLDYLSAVFLTEASRFFYHESPVSYASFNARIFHLLLMERRTRTGDCLACFRCFRLLPEAGFSKAMLTHRYTERGGQLQYRRRCNECEASVDLLASTERTALLARAWLDQFQRRRQICAAFLE